MRRVGQAMQQNIRSPLSLVLTLSFIMLMPSSDTFHVQRRALVMQHCCRC